MTLIKRPTPPQISDLPENADLFADAQAVLSPHLSGHGGPERLGGERRDPGQGHRRGSFKRRRGDGQVPHSAERCQEINQGRSALYYYRGPEAQQ